METKTVFDFDPRITEAYNEHRGEYPKKFNATCIFWFGLRIDKKLFNEYKKAKEG